MKLHKNNFKFCYITNQIPVTINYKYLTGMGNSI